MVPCRAGTGWVLLPVGWLEHHFIPTFTDWDVSLVGFGFQGSCSNTLCAVLSCSNTLYALSLHAATRCVLEFDRSTTLWGIAWVWPGGFDAATRCWVWPGFGLLGLMQQHTVGYGLGLA